MERERDTTSIAHRTRNFSTCTTTHAKKEPFYPKNCRAVAESTMLPTVLQPQLIGFFHQISWCPGDFSNSGISGVGLYTSFGAHINPRYYSFGESTWDLVFFIGTGALGPLGSWQTFLLAVVNVLMQVPSGRLTWRDPRWQYPVGEPSQKINFCGLPRLLDLDCWSPISERCRKNLR